MNTFLRFLNNAKLFFLLRIPMSNHDVTVFRHSSCYANLKVPSKSSTIDFPEGNLWFFPPLPRPFRLFRICLKFSSMCKTQVFGTGPKQRVFPSPRYPSFLFRVFSRTSYTTLLFAVPLKGFCPFSSLLCQIGTLVQISLPTPPDSPPLSMLFFPFFSEYLKYSCFRKVVPV